MNTVIFYIISTDALISGRWPQALKKEGWRVELLSCCPGEEGKCPGYAGIYLIEIGLPCCRNQEGLKSILQTRKPVSALVFGNQQDVSNRQISAFLEAGADDFVYKNIDERILVAKLKAHMRRIMPEIIDASAKLTSSCRSIEIDRNRRSVKLKAHLGTCTELSSLTPKEFDILSLLVAQERRVVTRERMLEKIWGEDAVDVYSECIDKHVESLRRKMGACGNKIKTIYGSGYMFMGLKKS